MSKLPTSEARAASNARGPRRAGASEAPRKTVRRPEDTIAGCEALAASDRARADAMDTANGRLKLEHSAASWQDRAELLQRLETSFNKRKALDKAEWRRADVAEQELENDRERLRKASGS